jgi:ferric-dicitrate binding protein FerR (iron transport regulator)
MGSNHQIDFQNVLNRMGSGQMTREEKEKLQEYIRNSFQDKELEKMMQEHWSTLEKVEVETDEMQMLLLKNQILSKIKQSEISNTTKQDLAVINWKNYLTRAAAILFIPLLIGSVITFYTLNKRFDQLSTTATLQQVIASPGSRVHFILPDNTEVWLNSGSKLEYSQNLNFQDTRNVKLSGQGYFKVAPDKIHPFLVQVDEMTIKALGTAFDVSCYENDAEISSTLEEGSIALIGENNREITRLNPGQKAVFDKETNELTVRTEETKLSTSWKDGKLIFKETSLEDVSKQLERWFNCSIQIDPKLIKLNLRYTATIQDETLGEVLKMIEISTSVQTKIEKREVYIGNKN